MSQPLGNAFFHRVWAFFVLIIYSKKCVMKVIFIMIIIIRTSEGLLETLNPWVTESQEFLQRAPKPVYTLFGPNLH